MKQERLSYDSEGDLERLLLRAGRAGAPPGAKKRALMAASGAAAASTLAAAEGTAAIAKAGSVVAVKWIGVLCLTGAGAVAGAAGLRAVHDLPRRTPAAVSTQTSAGPKAKAMQPTRADPAPADPPAPIVVAPTPAPLDAPVDPVPPTASAPETVATIRAPRPAPPSTIAARPPASSMKAELSTLDDAEGAIEAGNPAAALSILDGYRARFPRGEMEPEAKLLRIEALCRAGHHDAAERYARALLTGDPESPYAKRIQSLLSTTNP